MECPSQEGLTDEEKHGGLLFSVCLARLRTPSRARPLVRVSGEKLQRTNLDIMECRVCVPHSIRLTGRKRDFLYGERVARHREIFPHTRGFF